MATKNTPKAPADPAAAPTTDATAPAPAPAPDTTEANNADRPEQLPDAPAADQAATEPAADGAAEPAQAEAPQVTEPEPVLPAKIRLTCPFGFLDDENAPHWWGAGQEVTDPAEIKTLVAYNAEHEVLE